MGSYAHFAPFLKVIIFLVSRILRKNKNKNKQKTKKQNKTKQNKNKKQTKNKQTNKKRCKKGRKCKKHVPVAQCNKIVSTTYDTLALTFEYFVFTRGS